MEPKRLNPHLQKILQAKRIIEIKEKAGIEPLDPEAKRIFEKLMTTARQLGDAEKDT